MKIVHSAAGIGRLAIFWAGLGLAVASNAHHFSLSYFITWRKPKSIVMWCE